VSVSDVTLAALQLFAGEATFATGTRFSALKRVLVGEGAPTMAELLPRMCWTLQLFNRSDLQQACRQAQVQVQAALAAL
jgi:hypothetical protein